MQLSIAIPASLVSEVPHLREKTSRLGMVGRALAIFRISEVIVYLDKHNSSQHRDMGLISAILGYMETPQYLRKHLFPKIPELKYAGILPPLRTPHHPLTKRIADLENGEWREGVVIKTGVKTLVDIGVEHPISLNERNLSLWQRITVRIHKNRNKIKLKIAEEQHVKNMYWGYRLNASGLSLGQIMRSGTFDLIMLTSRYGKPLTEAFGELKSRWKKAKKILIAFGSPKQGLREILAREGLEMGGFGALVINTVPSQGVKTIRTEEAIYATLSVINAIL